jgi:hypothetical protein
MIAAAAAAALHAARNALHTGAAGATTRRTRVWGRIITNLMGWKGRIDGVRGRVKWGERLQDWMLRWTWSRERGCGGGWPLREGIGATW